MKTTQNARTMRLVAWAVLLGVMTLSALVMVPAAIAVPFDFSVNKLFVKDGRDQERLRSIQSRFTENDRDAIVMLSQTKGDWFAPERLEALNTLHRRIASIPIKGAHRQLLTQGPCAEPNGNAKTAFEQVQSVAQATIFRRRGTSVQIENLRDKNGYGETKRNREELLGHPLLKGRLISEDGRSTLLSARIRCPLKSDASMQGYLNQLRQVLTVWAQDHPSVKTHTTGIAFIQNDIILTMRNELEKRQPFVAFCMVVFLWLAFRRFRYAVLPFLSVALASVWWLGIVKLSGSSINIINFSTVTVILVIGVGDAIHLVARVEEGLDQGMAPWPALKEGWLAMLPATALTTLTTVIGFASLGVARVQLVRDYGLSAAIGIGLAWFFTLSVVPALLLLAPPKTKEKSGNQKLWLNRVALPAISRFVLKKPGLIAAISAFLLLVSALFAAQIEPFSRALDEVRSDHPAQIALDALEAQFAGTMPFDIVLEGPRHALLAPNNLDRMAALQDRLDASPAGVKTLSIVDLLGGLHGLWDQGQAGDRTTRPTTRQQVDALLAMISLESDNLSEPYLDDPAQEITVLDAEEDEEFVIEEEDEPLVAKRSKSTSPRDENRHIALRIAAIKKDSGSTVFAGEIDRIETALAQWPAPITGELTGASKLANQAVRAVIADMMSSLGLAFGLITFIFMLVLRSWRAGLLAMLPNILPLVVTLGMMTVSGISLRISTVIIFAMCMGVVVDDTIHFLVRFRQERAHQEAEAALDATIRHAGRPVVFTTLMLVMGFSVLITSHFNGLRNFGQLSALCIGLALLADLLTLPALLMLSERWRQRKEV